MPGTIGASIQSPDDVRIGPISGLGGQGPPESARLVVAIGSAEDRGGRVADALEVPLVDLRHAWDHGLARSLGWED